MTLAHAKTSRRSWRELLRVSTSSSNPPNHQSEPFHLSAKPPGDIADLLVMSTVDQKAPVAAPGSADLLDAMVQEHLERDADGAPRPAASPAPVAPPAVEDSGAMLQREIEMLLNDEAEKDPTEQNKKNQAAADARSARAEKQMRIQKAASQPAPAEPAPPPAGEVSSEEIDVLLARQAELPAEPPAASAVQPMVAAADAPAVSAAAVEEQLSEAEGVLAEELAKLVGEANGEVEETKPAAVAAPKSTSIVDESSAGPLKAAASTATPAGPHPPATQPQAAHAEPVATPVATADVPHSESPAVDAAETALQAKDERVHGVVEGLALTVAQLIDLPFRWLTELDKNMIGVAAAMLLLGGVVLFVLSRVTGT